MTDRILVMFIDDLQWSDNDSIDLMRALVSNLPSQRFLFVGGFRSDEVKEDQYLYKFLQKAQRDTVPATIMMINPLTVQAVAKFISESLVTDVKRVEPLANLIQEKTKGNIFFVQQLVESLYRSGNIFYSPQKFQWEWETLSALRDATANEFTIGDVVSKRILMLVSDDTYCTPFKPPLSIY